MEEKTANTEYANKEIHELCIKNKECFDCYVKKPSYVSINNSIFLCSSCAMKHKLYGDEISNVKSLYLDTWNNDQIKYLQTGGNQRLKELLLLYDFKNDNKSINKFILYGTNLMQFHRDTIQSEVLNLKCPIMPKAEEALLLSSKIPQEIIDQNQSKSKDSLYDKLGIFYSQSKDYAKDIYDSLTIENMMNKIRHVTNNNSTATTTNIINQ